MPKRLNIEPDGAGMGDVEKVMMTLLMTIPKVIFSRTDAKNIQLEKLQRSVKGRFWPSFF